MFQKLFINKRGIGFIGSLINIVSDTLSHLRELIGQMLSKAPRILYPVLFLFFILVIGGLMNFFLQMSGFHCDTNKNTVKVDIIDVVGNWDLYQRKPSEKNINSTEIDLESNFLGSDKCSVTFRQGTLEFENGSQIEFNDTKYFYDGVYCNQCSEIISVWNNWNGEHAFCYGDVYRNENITGRHLLFWSKNKECKKEGNYLCMPPENYFYNSSINKYQAIIISQANTLGKRYDQLLYDDYNGKPFSFHNETKAIDIRCNDNYDTHLTFFTINVFDFTLWILLYIFGAMVWIYLKFVRK